MKRFLIIAAAVFICGNAFAADSKEELKKSFQSRHAQLVKLKTEGKIGETIEGLVAVVDAKYLSEKGLKELLAAENADREKLYAILAKKEKADVKTVAENSFVFKFKKAGEGEWFRGRNGEWKQKKEFTQKAD